jgi:hypothetical protein
MRQDLDQIETVTNSSQNEQSGNFREVKHALLIEDRYEMNTTESNGDAHRPSEHSEDMRRSGEYASNGRTQANLQTELKRIFARNGIGPAELNGPHRSVI